MMVLMFVFMACHHEEDIKKTVDTGSLVLTFDTRAATPGDGEVSTGGGIDDLLVLLVNNNDAGTKNYVQGKELKTGLSNATTCTVSFENVVLGSYSVYVYANTDGLTDLATILDLEKGDEFTSGHADLKFSALTGDAVPNVSEKMLLTARKDIEIVLGTNSTRVELLRPYVRFLVELNNLSDKKMTVSSLSFSQFNASTSYVIPHDNQFNPGGSYRDLPPLSGGIVIPKGETKIIYNEYLYESKAVDYSFDMDLQAYFEGGVVDKGWTIAYIPLYGSTRYLASNGNTLTTVQGNFDDSCLWTVASVNENQKTYTIMNALAGKYLLLSKTGNRYSASLSSNSYNLVLDSSLDNLNSKTSKIKRNEDEYYLRYNNGLSVSTASTSWTFTKQTTSIAEGYHPIAYVENSPFVIVNPFTGVAQNMTEMKRNSLVKVSINAYYNDNEGSFSYEVVDWTEKNGDIEFQ